VAPCFYWERFKRSRPQNELEMMSKLGGKKKQIARTTHFRIFASLPGLNDPAFKRRGD
jgi:hypothetical protein